MASKVLPDKTDPLEGLFGDIFRKVMIGMTKAESVEAKTGKLRAKLRELTEERMDRVANFAGSYYAQHANPSPKKLSKEEVAILKTEAIEFALEQLENETET